MGLYSWDQLGDDYNFAQLAQNFQTIDYHDHSAGRGTQISAGGLAPGSVLSGNVAANQIGFQHLTLAAAQNLGVNISGNISQGYLSIPTSQTLTAPASYTLAATPDQISNIVITTGGLIFFAYQATWSASVATNGRAAIFLGSNQVQIASNSQAAPVVQEASSPNATNLRPLVSSQTGLVSDTSTGAAYTGNVATGQVLGDLVGAGVTIIFAPAGTYNISVQFKAASGNVTVVNRQMWVLDEELQLMAHTSPNILLEIWDLADDDFDYTVMASNLGADR